MTSSISMPAFVVCMEREKKRKKHIKKELEKFTINFTFCNAVDGKLLSEEEKKQWYSEEKAIDVRGRKLADAEIGCFLSHYKIWQKMVHDNTEMALVIESDAVFSEEALKSINKVAGLDNGWDLIMMFYRECFPSFWNQKKITDASNLVKFANKCACTTAYLLTLSGAKKLIDRAMPISLPVDDYMTGKYINKGLNTFAVYPRTVDLTEDNEETSTIREGVADIKNGATSKQYSAKSLEKRVRYFIKQCKPGGWL